MDTSKEYILMCEKAVEVQELWKPCQYDHLGFIDKCGGYGSSYYTPDTLLERAKKIGRFWLPRQDQLQGMFLKKPNVVGNLMANLNSLVHGLSIFMGDCSRKGECYFSMEQLWLALVMKEKFNKTWNGKDWVNK